MRLGDVERADPGPSQRGEVRVATERRAEIGRQRAHVRAARAVNDDRRLRMRPGLERLDLEPVDAHSSRDPFDLDTLSCELVQPLPLYLQRGDHRWDLLDLADEGRRR